VTAPATTAARTKPQAPASTEIPITDQARLHQGVPATTTDGSVTTATGTGLSAPARPPERLLLAGFRPRAASTTTAATAARAARVVIDEVDTLDPNLTPEIVPGPGAPLPSPLGPPPRRELAPPSGPPSGDPTPFSDPVLRDDTSEPAPPPEAGSRRRRWWIALSVAAGLFVSLLIASALVPIPYYAISPGDASSAEARITVSGVPSYHDPGEVLFVTVTSRHLTVLDGLFAWLDPDTDIVGEDQYLGNRTPQQTRQEDLRAMGFSKDVATYVALHHLGYPVQVIDGGAVIDQFASGAPVAKVLNRNDVITAVDGTRIDLPSDISKTLQGKHPGDDVTLTVRRNTTTTTEQVKVALARRDDGSAIIGIVADVPDTVRFKFPFTVDIGTGSIGGPSAGLAFTIATLDALTPGSITGGHKVAVTGTIDVNGNVGAIGGLPQKTIAVMRAGADLFIVPKSELADAQKAAKGSRLRVVGVDTLDEALTALADLGGNAAHLPAQAAA